MLVIVTTNNPLLLEEMGIMHIFDDRIDVAPIKTRDEFRSVLVAQELLPMSHVDKAADIFSTMFPIGVKKLITMIEFARQPMPGASTKSNEDILSDFRQLYAKAIEREE
jgi:hypothetical protein